MGAGRQAARATGFASRGVVAYVTHRLGSRIARGAMRKLRDLLFSRTPSVDTLLAENIEILHESPLLDPVWYRQTYSDLRDTPIDVARHYLEHGAAEGRNPSPAFDTVFYLQANPDVASSG